MATSTIDIYYQILGISSKATIEEIRRAYRQKAKELHPDRNDSPDANEQFILLTEAYECLISIRKGKSKVQQSSSTSYADWQTKSREQARQRAREYAKMKYEEYKKTHHYKKSQAADTVMEHLYFFSSILILISPIIGFILSEWAGLGVGILIAFLSVHYWAGIFTEKINIDFNSFYQSLVLVCKTKTFQYTAITLINIFILFGFTLNTKLTFLSLTLILLALFVLTYLLLYLRFIVKYF